MAAGVTALPEPGLELAELTRCDRCTEERMCDVHMWLRIRTWPIESSEHRQMSRFGGRLYRCVRGYLSRHD